MLKNVFGVLVLGSLCASGCASSQAWNRVQTKNITLYTTTDQQYKETLRQLENTYASLSASFFKGKQIGNVDVLFMDDPDFIKYFGAFRTGAALAFVPGDGAIGKDGLLVLRPNSQSISSRVASDPASSAGNGYTPSDPGLPPPAGSFAAGTGALGNMAGVSAKEMLTHIFIQRAMPNVPLWFHEGFAGYVSTSEVRGGNGQTFGCFGFPVPGESMMSVSSIWDAGFDKYAQVDYRGWFKTTATTLIDYLMHADDNKHRGAMGPLVNDLAAGKPSAEVVTAAFDGANVKAIDTLLSTHRQNLTQMVSTNAPVRGQCPFGVLIAADALPDEATPKITPAPPADVEALLRALGALPAVDEYPPFYPKEILAKVKVPAKR